ncbi:MAG: BatA domain-containing protein, partial [Desulfobacterales bacterium]
MSFLSPWFLLGVLGVTIPLAIHLSRRQKAEKVVFSTIRFLKQTPKKMILFQKIRHWLLLLIRAAIIALLAVAFARPFLSQAVTERIGW